MLAKYFFILGEAQICEFLGWMSVVIYTNVFQRNKEALFEK